MKNFGISTALVTPFTASGALDSDALRSHIRNVLALGADGVTLFGTTGEGASVAFSECEKFLAALTPQDVARDRVTLAVYATAVEDAVARIKVAAEHGVTRILLPPPYYFKDIDQDALFDWYDSVLSASPAGTQAILYHIPQVTQVPLSQGFVQRLQAAHPAKAVAVKDSSGDWDNTKALLEYGGVAVLVGDERRLAAAARLGCAGSITGMANVFPDRLKRILKTGEKDKELDVLIEAVVANPVTSAVKYMVSEHYGNPDWRRVRAPLSPTPETAFSAIDTAFRALQAPVEG